MPKTTLYLLFVLFVAIMGAFFAFENQDPMSVQLGRWTWETSEAPIILIAFGIGLLLAGLASIPSLVSRSLEIRSLKKKIKGMDEELDAVRDEKEQLAKKFDALEEKQAKQENGIEEIEAV